MIGHMKWVVSLWIFFPFYRIMVVNIPVST